MFRLGKRRSKELLTLRGRLVVWRRQDTCSETEKAAQTLLAHKLELARLVGSVSACSGCARGCEGKVGRFDGGLCCSGSTANVFEDEEIAALAMTGTRPADLVASGEDAGCVFRGARGCVLPVQHRPSVCIHYICRELMAELGEQGRSRQVADAQDRLRLSMEAFAGLFQVGKDEVEFREIFGIGPEVPRSSLSNRELEVEEPA